MQYYCAKLQIAIMALREAQNTSEKLCRFHDNRYIRLKSCADLTRGDTSEKLRRFHARVDESQINTKISLTVILTVLSTANIVLKCVVVIKHWNKARSI